MTSVSATYDLGKETKLQMQLPSILSRLLQNLHTIWNTAAFSDFPYWMYFFPPTSPYSVEHLIDRWFLMSLSSTCDDLFSINNINTLLFATIRIFFVSTLLHSSPYYLFCSWIIHPMIHLPLLPWCSIQCHLVGMNLICSSSRDALLQHVEGTVDFGKLLTKLTNLLKEILNSSSYLAELLLETNHEPNFLVTPGKLVSELWDLDVVIVEMLAKFIDSALMLEGPG